MSKKTTARTTDRPLVCRVKPGRLSGAVVMVSLILAGSPVLGGEAMTGFALPDVNPSSLTYGQMVSPADFEGMTSGWYFGHAT
jgi:hypothetical protein